MAAVAVLGIAALGTVPSLSTSIQSTSPKSATRTVSVKRERARADAIAREPRCRTELGSERQMALYRYEPADLAWQDFRAQTAKSDRNAGLWLGASRKIAYAASRCSLPAMTRRSTSWPATK